MRSRRPFWLAGLTIRHPRVRRRPVALVFRRPPRTRPPAPQLVVRAGDQVSVTLAPRFTVVLQQVARAAAVVGRPDRTAPSRPGAPEVVADAGRLAIVHHRWSRGAAPPLGRWLDRVIACKSVARWSARQAATPPLAPAGRPQTSLRPIATDASHLGSAPLPAPPLGRSLDRVIVCKIVARWSARQAATPPLAPAGRPQMSLRPIATDASHLGSAPRPAAPQLVVAARTGEGAPGRPGQADAGEVASPRRRGGLDVADPPRIRWVIGNLATRRSAAAPQRSGDRPATASPSPPRFELALGGSARSGRRREPRVAPVATVYRQARSMELPAPAPLPVPAVNASAAHPAIDIDQLDRELWRRFEKRARTERERRGRA